jgi:hypothetical protein
MKPIHFSESNKTLLKPQDMTDEECGSLPVFADEKTCISLWRMSWRERLSALFFGNIWLYVNSGHTQPPVALEAARTIFEKKETMKNGT